MTERGRYPIVTLADLLTVPEDRLRACLADVETMVRMHHGFHGMFNAAAEAVSGISDAVATSFRSFVWIDDDEGKADITIVVSGPDGPEEGET